ncbi:MAG TPA: NAD(P)/FAD-dependent oxidoreductase [Labilithrix sp.]|jgi:thioredoxin reductase
MGEDRVDVVIVGGGPAGLSAALLLGRSRRKVVVVDAGRQRNRPALASHAFFTRDGASPTDLLRIAREQLEPYEVAVKDDEAIGVEREPGGFAVRTRAGLVVRGEKLLLATGVRDRVPDIDGIDALFGKSVFVCPYCDAWEQRDRRLAAWTRADGAVVHGLALTTWSADVAVFTNGDRLAPSDRERLERARVTVFDERVDALERDGGKLLAVRLASGACVERDALFVHLGEEPAAPFAEQLGCALQGNERTDVPGVWVAGDLSHDTHLVAVAVAEGVKAACAINKALREARQ